MKKQADKPVLDREILRKKLVGFVGEAKPLEDRISSISDMNELIKLWTENSRDPGVQAIIEARMTEVIKALPVDNIDQLPAWFITIVQDEVLLPLKMLRVLFREKAREINSLLSKDQDTSQT